MIDTCLYRKMLIFHFLRESLHNSKNSLQGSGNNRKKFVIIMTKKSTKGESAADKNRVRLEGKLTRKSDSQGLFNYDRTTTGNKRLKSKAEVLLFLRNANICPHSSSNDWPIKKHESEEGNKKTKGRRDNAKRKKGKSTVYQRKVHCKGIWQTYHSHFYQRKNTSDHHDHHVMIWHSYHRHFYQRKNHHRQYNDLSTEITGHTHHRQCYQRENCNQQSLWKPPWIIWWRRGKKLFGEDEESDTFIWRPPWRPHWSTVN